MRVPKLLVPITMVLMACGGGEEPAVDSAATAAAPAPAGLTEADFAGTWNGSGRMEGDTTVMRFTDVCANGTCTSTFEGSPESTTSTYRIEGDSVVGTAPARMDPNFKQNVLESWTLRIVDGKAVGTAIIKAADKDSVLARINFEATKAP
jgi:hypothetical protein